MARWMYRQSLNGNIKTIQFFSSYQDALKEQKRFEWDFKRFEPLRLEDDDILETIISSSDGRSKYSKKHTYKEYKELVGGTNGN